MLKKILYKHDPDVVTHIQAKRNSYVHYISISVAVCISIPILESFLSGDNNVGYFLAAIDLSLFALFFLNKKLAIKNSIPLLVALILIMANGLMLLEEGVRNNSIVIFPAAIFVSSLSFDRRVVYVTLLSSIISIWFVGILELNNILNFELSRYANYQHILDLSLIMLCITIAVDLFAVDVLNSLKELIFKTKELQSINTKLEETNRAKDKFFTIVAHDLRSPFQGILGVSEILTKEVDDLSKDDIREFSKTMNKALHHQYRLMSSLLDWSRIQTGRMKYYPSKIIAHKAAMEAFYQIGPVAFEKNIKIKINFDNDIEVFADFDMLTMVFRNLISNAVKFSHPNNQVFVDCTKTDHELQFTVIDCGTGIDENELPTLFRLDNSITHAGTANETGTGLGLIICSEIIDKHGGKIWVNSTYGKGSKFYFTIPRSKEKFKFTNGC